MNEPISAAGYSCICCACGSQFINANKRAVWCQQCKGNPMTSPHHRATSEPIRCLGCGSTIPDGSRFGDPVIGPDGIRHAGACPALQAQAIPGDEGGLLAINPKLPQISSKDMPPGASEAADRVLTDMIRGTEPPPAGTAGRDDGEEQYSEVEAERDNAISDRDALRAEVEQWRDAHKRACDTRDEHFAKETKALQEVAQLHQRLGEVEKERDQHEGNWRTIVSEVDDIQSALGFSKLQSPDLAQEAANLHKSLYRACHDHKVGLERIESLLEERDQLKAELTALKSPPAEHVVGVDGVVRLPPLTGVSHELKCWPSPFAAMRYGIKQFEYRKDDRDYAVGDVLHINEFRPPSGAPDDAGDYTGEGDRYVVTYKLVGAFGVPDGYCVLGVAALAKGNVRVMP